MELTHFPVAHSNNYHAPNKIQTSSAEHFLFFQLNL